MEQVEENLHAAEISAHGIFTTSEKKAIAGLRKNYRAGIAVPCTNCKYCMPCPHGVDIPANFEFFNHAHLYNDLPAAKFRYSIYLTPAQRSDKCIACKECEEKCPQEIKISTLMPKVSELLSPAK